MADKANHFRRGGVTVLAGSAIGSLIFLAFTPLISRVFDPSSFGVYATILAVSSSTVGASTLRLEVLGQTVPDPMAAATMRAALIAATTFAVATTLVTVVVVVVRGLNAQWLWVGPLVLLSALQLVGSASEVRARRYKALGTVNFIQNAVVGPLQCGLGLGASTPSSLVAGYALSKLAWLRSLARRPSRGRVSAWEAWRPVRLASLQAGGSAAINSMATQSPVLLAAALYGSTNTAMLAMAIRLTASPVGLVAAAAGGAAMGEAGALLREGRHGEAQQLVKRGMRDLLSVGALPAMVVIAIAPLLAPRVLGETWSAVGPLISVMTVGLLADFATSPFSQVCNLTGRSRSLLVWDAARLLLFGAAFAVPFLLGVGMSWAVLAWSVAQVVLSGVMAKMSIGAAGARRGDAGLGGAA